MSLFVKTTVDTFVKTAKIEFNRHNTKEGEQRSFLEYVFLEKIEVWQDSMKKYYGKHFKERTYIRISIEGTYYFISTLKEFGDIDFKQAQDVFERIGFPSIRL